ncbi:MAG: YihA family ribosome biogenesis GTP-binding protein [Gammaproteobacteria bacterium]|nr:MAG: YihA family ribosome biogenesis GTP-binding protein [Gammaproteobacteria bacterium]
MPQLFRQARFLLSANSPKQFPDDSGYEVAFVGRSNCGKSTTLNALCQQKNLAKVSKTPGRTQMINFFQLDEQRRLVDLPGYGYAQVSRKKSGHWSQLLDRYCQSRHSLSGIVLIMDIRHPLKELDQILLDWAQTTGMPVHILLNKSDKLGRGEANRVRFEVSDFIAKHTHPDVAKSWDVQTFSAQKKQGLDEVYTLLKKWFRMAPQE